MTNSSQLRSITSLDISPIYSHDNHLAVTAIVVPKVTCHLPLHPIIHKSSWTHLEGITLADPDFNRPGRVDILLGVDIYIEALLHGRRAGRPNSPVAFETTFGWDTSREN